MNNANTENDVFITFHNTVQATKQAAWSGAYYQIRRNFWRYLPIIWKPLKGFRKYFKLKTEYNKMENPKAAALQEKENIGKNYVLN